MSDAPSRLDALRAGFAKQAENPRLFKRLPRPENVELVAEYKVLPYDQARDLFNRDDFESCQDSLVNALVAIHVHDDQHPDADDRGLVGLGAWLEQDFGAPLRFDKRFAEAVGIEPGTAREIALQVFGGNEIALATQAGELGAWMTDTSVVQFQDFTPGS